MDSAGISRERQIYIGGDISQSNFYRMKPVTIHAMCSILSLARLSIIRVILRLLSISPSTVNSSSRISLRKKEGQMNRFISILPSKSLL
jgi:cytochrome b561